MDIKILDSHLREYVETTAKPLDIAKALSLSSASVERVDPYGKDFVYSIEITTNRPDMASVKGFAREAATVLPLHGYKATFIPLKLSSPKVEEEEKKEITVKNDDTLVRRICAVVMDVTQKDSPQYIKDRLEAAGIRSLNNLVDITNYVMLETGHPTHVFDYDRLKNHQLIIRPSKKGEKIVTLDGKEHTLFGGDIVADNGEGEIVDLLGVMGTANSVVTDDTKTILFFLDNNDPWKIRKTSMGLAIRTDAAALNEKGIDPELAWEALLRGIELYKEIADAKIVSDPIDIYPHKPKLTTTTVSKEKIDTIIGVPVSLDQSAKILTDLGFSVKKTKDSLTVTPPTSRALDVTIPEDVVEEIARVYGYHNIPSILPPFTWHTPYHMDKNPFYWEMRAKEAMKYWGYIETYTYSLVSETMLEGPIEKAITLSNPLDSEHVHMRTSLVPSLLAVAEDNRKHGTMRIFELSNVYIKKGKGLPEEVLTLTFLHKQYGATFQTAKGIAEQLFIDFGIREVTYEEPQKGGIGADIYVGKEYLGDIEVLENSLVTVELNFSLITKHANRRKTYTPLPKYPPVIEDIAFVVDQKIKTGDIIAEIKKQNKLIHEVSLLDMYEGTRTFHVVYLDRQKNLTTEEVAKIREQITSALSKKFEAKIK